MEIDYLKLPLLAEPKRLLLDMAQTQSVSDLLNMVVTRLSASGAAALVRIWLVQNRSSCVECDAAKPVGDQTRCLQLVASGGRSCQHPPIAWTDTHGEFRHLPMGSRKVGLIAATGQAIEVPHLSGTLPEWIARPEWIRSELIQGFAGQPLVHHGEVLGVLAIFARQPIAGECMGWLRMIADHTAAAINTSRAFSKIDELKNRLQLENDYLREEVTGTGAFGEMIGSSPALEAVTRQIDLVASTESTVLILGESGTGKELVAREIHRRSRRADRPLIKVNCAAIPRELYDSEFFGHARGSFTGALRDRVGRFELAEGGTLFLDEIGEIPLDLQAKLLRVLQEGELERVGEERTRKVDVRLVTATNRDLRAEAEAGRFRQDLYYRLSVFPLEVPPLRKRKEDIPLLVSHFLGMSSRKAGRASPPITLANIQKLQRYDWPGNVRELQHVVERSVITSPQGKLIIELPSATVAVGSQSVPVQDQIIRTEAQMRQLEADNIRMALKATSGKVSGSGGAAHLLGIKSTTLASRMKALGIVLQTRQWGTSPHTDDVS